MPSLTEPPSDERRLTLLTACAVDPRRGPRNKPAFRNVGESWPAEADFILSALEAAAPSPSEADRRAPERFVHRALVELQLYSDVVDAAPWTLYSRDATTRDLGFITRHRLPLGYGGVVHLRGPRGEELSIDCTLRRCRETVSGWFEGALSFNREQWAFSPENFGAKAAE